MDAEQKIQIEKYSKLIKEVKIATLVTHSGTDGLKGRPMGTADVDDNGAIWFFTNEFTEKVEEINSNNSVLVSYTSLTDSSYVVVNGHAEVVTDKAMMTELWNPALKAWFPDGLEDDRLSLLKVQPEEVEYWNGNSNKAVFAFKMLKAIVKGEEFRDVDHDKISLS